MKDIIHRLKPFIYIGGLYLFISLVLRLIFVYHPITTASFSWLEVVKLLGIGLLSDVLIAVLINALLMLYMLLISNSKYKNPYGWLLLVAFIAFLGYIQFYPNNIFNQYGGVIPEIALAFFGSKTFCFGLLLIWGKQRVVLRNILYFITLVIYVFAIVMNGVSEYFFWNEFGIRYNFIAVDYLIYTNEVIGNIMESYPVVPLFSVVGVVVVALTLFIFVKTKPTIKDIPSLKQKVAYLLVYSVIAILAVVVLPKLNNLSASNIFAKEIQSNGVYKFYYAFTHSELDYEQFYPAIDEKVAEETLLQSLQAGSIERKIVSQQAEKHYNVVLISVESLSAEYLTMYGNDDNRTPFLDELAKKSMFFTNLYATGNRTVRGLEALTLCLPPTPGESVVKRKDNKDKFTTGSVFRSKGYDVKFLYGGDSYFDNMKDFFGGNGYDIVDRSSFSPEEVTFANIWGVCDEDMANKAIAVMNEQSKTGKPFFNHWMTVSNHRPFTYPEGKIDIPPTEKRRAGGGKYTDYALKRFFEMAAKQKWYKNTLFVVVADHCASSAGSTELPLDGYRIPCFIYADFIPAQKIDTLVSQIDVMPTVMGLLNFSYTSKFIGQDVLTADYQPRAYIATYQDLGYLTPERLTVISPVKKVRQYDLHLEAEQPVGTEYPLYYSQEERKDLEERGVLECIARYQSTSYWLKNQQLNASKK